MDCKNNGMSAAGTLATSGDGDLRCHQEVLTDRSRVLYVHRSRNEPLRVRAGSAQLRDDIDDDYMLIDVRLCKEISEMSVLSEGTARGARRGSDR